MVLDIVKNLHRGKQIIFTRFDIYKDYFYEKLIVEDNDNFHLMSETKQKVN